MARGLLVLCSFSVFAATSAYGALGDNVITSSGFSKVSSSKATTSMAKTTSGVNYTVSETTDAAGIKIRQYSDASGLIFAISWKGPVVPDLQLLFGNYTTEYRATLEKRPKMRGSRYLKVDTGKIVVEGGGRQWDQKGRAYITKSLPSGFNLEDINSND
ncbi:MAG: DUF2844 domain-containing protein [Bdellovibrio sp.]|nr:DUF2844 domain-containing protein [Bdellovibrio sp.]